MNIDCVCFGEILFDVLPTEKKAGGAPMNVAYHLNKLGSNTALISRVGKDANGDELKDFLQKKNIGIDFLQEDEQHPTGVVLATPNEHGDMSYEIIENAAWDFIDLKSEYETLIAKAGYFIFGSLATRSQVSKDTLFHLMDIPCKKVFDINLRAPFINKDLIEYQMNKADILKMNEEELDLVSGWYARSGNIEDKISFLQDKFHIPTLIVTRAAKGAVVNYKNTFYYHNGFKVKVADTIGSGDSFLAGFLSHLLGNKTTEDALAFACALGAFVATKNGGCPDYSVRDLKSVKI